MVTAAQAKSLRAQLHAAGVFQHHEASSWAKLGICLTVVAACITGMALGPAWLTFVLVPLQAMFLTAAAMLGHEGSHRSISSNPRRNALMQHVAFPLLGGLGAIHWRNKHDVLHHGHPNVRGADPDIALWPMTSCEEDHKLSNPVRRWLQRNVQGYIFWPLTLFLPMMMRISSMRVVVAQFRRRGLTREVALDAACQLGHYAIFLVLPILIWGPIAFAVYAATWAIVGVMLALIFAPAHIGLPIIVDQNCDWEHQLETTRNLALPRWLSWFFVGLDYQVEHHLFPKIAHQELPRASAILKRWCEEVGLRHHTISYGPGLVDVTTFLHNAWRTPATSGAVVRAETTAYAAAVTGVRPDVSIESAQAGVLAQVASGVTAPSSAATI